MTVYLTVISDLSLSFQQTFIHSPCALIPINIYSVPCSIALFSHRFNDLKKKHMQKHLGTENTL